MAAYHVRCEFVLSDPLWSSDNPQAKFGSTGEGVHAQYEHDLEKLNAQHFSPGLPEDSLDAVGEALGLAFSKAIVDAAIPSEEQKAAVEEIEQQIAERREPAKDELAKLVKHIKDRDAYLADVCSLLAKYIDSTVDDSLDRLIDVKTTEDEAEGFRESPGKPRQRITFKRIAGAWRVDQEN